MPDDQLERRLRRSYAVLVFGGPWLLGFTGLGLVVFALLAHTTTTTQVAAFGTGAVLAIIGFLSLRISGPVELTPKGLKGHLDAVPTDALYVARAAATHAATDESNSDPAVKAGNAAFEAMEDFSAANVVARILTTDEREREVVLLILTRDNDLRRRFIEIMATSLIDQLERAAQRGETLPGNANLDEATVKRLQEMLEERGSHDSETEADANDAANDRTHLGSRNRFELNDRRRRDR